MGAPRLLGPVMVPAADHRRRVGCGRSVVVLAVRLLIAQLPAVERPRAWTGYGRVVRALWLIVATLGLIALVNNIADIVHATDRTPKRAAADGVRSAAAMLE